jgi:hypothetical protein
VFCIHLVTTGNGNILFKVMKASVATQKTHVSKSLQLEQAAEQMFSIDPANAKKK